MSNNIDITNTFSSGFDKPPQLSFSKYMSVWRFIALVQIFDFTLFSAIAFHWLWALSHPVMRHWWLVHILVSFMIAATVCQVFQNFRLYDFHTLLSASKAVPRSLVAGLMATAPLSVMLFTRPDLSLDFVISACGTTISGLLAVTAIRLPVARLAGAWLQKGIVTQRYFIIGNTASGVESLRKAFEASGRNRVIGILVLPEDDDKIESTLTRVCDFLRSNPVDSIVLKLPISQPDRVTAAIRVLRCVPRQILLAPIFEDIDDLLLSSDSTWNRHRGTDGVLLVKLSDRPLAGWRWILKDLQDRLIAMILLILMSPVMIAAALAVKIGNPGPVFFCQERRGYGGKTFRIFKFRTMRITDGYDQKRELKLTTRNDPRVFPIGRLLRKTSIDELPQLLNVLKGDMWIVGPRPHSPLAQAGGQIYANAVKDYGARYRLKPGITGWAQVSGWRGPTDTIDQLKGRVECDLYYVENWSVWFDLQILVRTLTCAIGQENAF